MQGDADDWTRPGAPCQPWTTWFFVWRPTAGSPVGTKVVPEDRGAAFSVRYTEEDRHDGVPDAVMDNVRRTGRPAGIRASNLYGWLYIASQSAFDTAGRPASDEPLTTPPKPVAPLCAATLATLARAAWMSSG